MTCIRRKALIPFPRQQMREPQQPPAVGTLSSPGQMPSHCHIPSRDIRTQWFCAHPAVRGVGSLPAAPALHRLLPPLPCTGEVLAAARLKGTGNPDWAQWNGLIKTTVLIVPNPNNFLVWQLYVFWPKRQFCIEREVRTKMSFILLHSHITQEKHRYCIKL